MSAKVRECESAKATAAEARRPASARACRSTFALSHFRTFALRARRVALALALALPLAACADSGPAKRELRVCADPNNLPFSNQARQGFENRIAELVARDLGAELRYTWWAQRRGFIRNTLRSGACDLVLGIPTSVEMVEATRPYYRSTYVFLYRKDAGLRLRSFDDPALRRLTIGVQLVGDDYANAPPAHALARRGIVGNLRGYSVYGDYSRPNPPASIVRAVERKEVDVAVVWGPLAGYFAKRSRVPMEIVPVRPQVDVPFFPFVYDISMGVRRGDAVLKSEVDAILARERPAIDRILDDYGVPRVESPAHRS